MNDVSSRLGWLPSLIFVACFFPFVSPVPVGSDVQPLVGGLGLLMFFCYLFLNDTRVKLEYLGVLVFVVVASLHLGGEWRSESSKIAAMYVAAFGYIGLDLAKERLSARVLVVSAIVYCLASFLMLSSTAEFVALQNHIVRNTNSVIIGYRGVSTFATEPGLLAGLIVGLLAIGDHLKRNGKLHGAGLAALWIAGVCVIIMTRSGTGVAYLLFYLLVRGRATIGVKTLAAIVLAFALLLLLLVMIQEGVFGTDFSSLGRAGSVLYILATSPEEFSGDRSILYRLYAVVVSWGCFEQHPFGVGFGGVASCSDQIVSADAALTKFYYSFGEHFHAVSSFGYYLSALGVFFLIPFTLFLLLSRIRFDFKMLALLFFMFSYSVAFPIIWCLLSLGAMKSVGKK